MRLLSALTWLTRQVLHLAAGLATQAVRVLAAALFFIPWRLAEGPIPLDLAQPEIERAGLALAPGLPVSAGGLVFDWRAPSPGQSGPDPGPALAGRDLVLGPVDNPLLQIQAGEVALDRAALLRGQILPVGIGLDGVQVQIRRSEEGALALALRMPAESADPDLTTQAETAPVVSPAGLLAQIGSGPLAGLRQVRLGQGGLILADAKAGWYLQASGLTLLLQRTADGLQLDADASAHWGMARLPLTLKAVLKPDGAALTAAIADLSVAQLAEVSPHLAPLAGSTLPLDLSMAAAVDAEGRILGATARLVSSGGVLAVSGGAALTQPIESLSADLAWDPESGRITLEPLALTLPETAVTARMTAAPQPGGAWSLAGAAALDRPLAHEALPRLWPAIAAPGAREWVLEHLSGGVVTAAGIEAALGVSPAGTVAVETLAAEIKPERYRLQILPGMPALSDVSGTVRISRDQVQISAIGDAGALRLTRPAEITIRGIDQRDQFARIALQPAGTIRAALDLLETTPAGIAGDLPVPISAIGGSVAGSVVLELPLQKDDDRLDVTADLELSDLAVPGLVEGRDLTEGRFDLTLRPEAGLTLKGRGLLDGIATQATLTSSLKRGAPLTASASLEVSAERLAAEIPVLAGRVGGRARVTVALPDVAKAATAPLPLRVDGEALRIQVAEAGFTKPAGQPLDLRLTLQPPLDGPQLQIRDLVLTGGGWRLAGEIEAPAAGEGPLLVALREVVTASGDQLALRYEDPGGQTLPRLTVTGPRLNLAALRGGSGGAGAGARGAPAPAAPLNLADLDLPLPLQVEARLGRLDVENDLSLTEVVAEARPGMAQLSARYRGAGFRAVLTAEGGERRLQVTARDAGAVAAALGISGDVSGGSAEVQARQRGDSAPVTGRVVLLDFRLRNTPLLARLLSTLSLGGLVELLAGGEGLAFDRFAVDFESRGTVLLLRNGRTAGNALGMTVEGSYDRGRERLDLQGTVVPAQTLNSILGAVPILGQILTGMGGEGIFAATYRMSGPADNPEIFVNPLAALAPGIIRNIFFLTPEGEIEQLSAGDVPQRRGGDYDYLERN